MFKGEGEIYSFFFVFLTIKNVVFREREHFWWTTFKFTVWDKGDGTNDGRRYGVETTVIKC